MLEHINLWNGLKLQRFELTIAFFMTVSDGQKIKNESFMKFGWLILQLQEKQNTSMYQSKKLKLFHQIQSKQVDQLKKNPVQASCLFDINFQKVETADSLPVNDIKICIQIRANYMIQCNPKNQDMISALKLNYFVKIKTSQQENQESSSNKYFVLKVNSLLSDETISMQDIQSEYYQCNKFQLFTSDEKSYKKFIRVLFAKPIVQEVQDLRMLFKPGKLIKTAKIGKIYEGSSLITKEKIIVKAYSKQFLQQQNKLKLVLQQLNFLQSLHQPQVIKIKKVYCTAKTIYVIFPQYHFNLTAFIKIYGNKVNNAQAILKVVMKVLSNLHEQKIVHGNINSQHILVNQKNGNLIQAVVIGLDNCIDFSKMSQKTGQYSGLMIEETWQNKFEQQSARDIQMAGNLLNKMIIINNQEPQLYHSSHILDTKSNPHHFPNVSSVPESALDLLNKMMDIEPKLRIKSEQTLQHDFLKEKYGLEQELKFIQHAKP